MNISKCRIFREYIKNKTDYKYLGILESDMK